MIQIFYSLKNKTTFTDHAFRQREVQISKGYTFAESDNIFERQSFTSTYCEAIAFGAGRDFVQISGIFTSVNLHILKEGRILFGLIFAEGHTASKLQSFDRHLADIGNFHFIGANISKVEDL